MNSPTVSMASELASARLTNRDATRVVQGDADVSFTLIGPAGIRIVGSTSALSVADDGERVTVTVSIAKLKTGMPLRDANMREQCLEVGRHPNARLMVERAALKFPDRNVAEATATGIMTIRGESRRVTFHYSAVRTGAWLHVSGDAQINMTDYGVSVPPYLGMTVKPHVALRVSFSVLDA
jgi:polyisoprenoid-binding protein YceI